MVPTCFVCLTDCAPVNATANAGNSSCELRCKCKGTGQKTLHVNCAHAFVNKYAKMQCLAFFKDTESDGSRQPRSAQTWKRPKIFCVDDVTAVVVCPVCRAVTTGCRKMQSILHEKEEVFHHILYAQAQSHQAQRDEDNERAFANNGDMRRTRRAQAAQKFLNKLDSLAHTFNTKVALSSRNEAVVFAICVFIALCKVYFVTMFLWYDKSKCVAFL